jgi:hypothetical protein
MGPQMGLVETKPLKKRFRLPKKMIPAQPTLQPRQYARTLPIDNPVHFSLLSMKFPS